MFTCLNEATEQTNIQIIVLTFGSDADNDLLERLVEDNKDHLLTTTPDNVLEQLITLFFDS